MKRGSICVLLSAIQVTCSVAVCICRIAIPSVYTADTIVCATARRLAVAPLVHWDNTAERESFHVHIPAIIHIACEAHRSVVLHYRVEMVVVCRHRGGELEYGAAVGQELCYDRRSRAIAVCQLHEAVVLLVADGGVDCDSVSFTFEQLEVARERLVSDVLQPHAVGHHALHCVRLCRSVEDFCRRCQSFGVSIHAPTWGATLSYFCRNASGTFQSTPPRGGRRTKYRLITTN